MSGKLRLIDVSPERETQTAGSPCGAGSRRGSSDPDSPPEASRPAPPAASGPPRLERFVLTRVGSPVDRTPMDDRDDRLWDKDHQRKGEEPKWGLILWLVVIVVMVLFLGYGLARWRFEVWTSLYG
jgi:hypothetical protein